MFQTSANPSGERAPHRFEDIDTAIRSGADLAIDGGELTGEPSTVLDLTGFERGEWGVLRGGGLAVDVAEAALRRALGPEAGTPAEG